MLNYEKRLFLHLSIGLRKSQHFYSVSLSKEVIFSYFSVKRTPKYSYIRSSISDKFLKIMELFLVHDQPYTDSQIRHYTMLTFGPASQYYYHSRGRG